MSSADSAILVLCFFTLIQSTYQTSTINGTIVKTLLCNESGIRCTDDCSTLLVCGSDKITPIKTVFCPDTSDTPYCTKNECSSSTIGTCSTKVSSLFKCTESGIFPDPDDCTRYRQCNDVGITADYYQFPAGYNYNSLIGLCDKDAVCDTIGCSDSNVEAVSEAVTFKLNPRFYAFCYTTGTGIRMRSPIYQCNANLIFSKKANTCVYQCASPGVFKDLTDCHAYFTCSGPSSNLKWVRKVCPTNFYFDGKECASEQSPCSCSPMSTPSGGSVVKVSSSTIGTCSTKVSSLFKCTESGIFPDPDDCTRYRQCNDVGITADYCQCPVGYNYNSLIGLCDATAVCDTIDCSEVSEAVKFKLNPRFYAFCNTTPTGIRMRSPIYQCNANLIFSEKANTCVYPCASAGVFKDLTDCHAYFTCSGSISNLKWVRKVCPTNFYFDGKECAPGQSPCGPKYHLSVVKGSDTNSNDTVDATS